MTNATLASQVTKIFYLEIGVVEFGIRETIAKLIERSGCHVAISPVDHAVVGHWGQL